MVTNPKIAEKELRQKFKKRATLGIIIAIIGIVILATGFFKGSTSGIELGAGIIALGVGFVLFAQATLSLWG